MKKKNQNSIKEKMNKIMNILDKRYFHTCVSIKDSEEIEWEIFYKNLPNDVYFSYKNKPLLSSDKNTIKDIYKLKDKFEKEKQIEFEKNLREYIDISFAFFKIGNKASREFSNSISNVILVILGASFANLIFLNNVYFGFLCMILTILITIFGILRDLEIIKTMQKEINDHKEDFIQEKIRRLGLYFVKRLRYDV